MQEISNKPKKRQKELKIKEAVEIENEAQAKAKGRQRKSTNTNPSNCYICETEVQNELVCEICRRKCHMFCACAVKKKKEWFCQLCS